MLLNNEIYIKLSNRTITQYLSKGYHGKIGETIKIKTIDLPNKSRFKVNVKCDICGKEKTLTYQKYTKNISKYSYYTCSQKCSTDKCKMTFIEKYGVCHPMKSKIIKEKSKNTCELKYNEEFYFQTNKFKEKSKNTSMKKYGVEHPMKSKYIRNTLQESLFKIYGVKNPMFLDSIKDKVKNTKISNGVITPNELVTELLLYKRKVKNITYKFKNLLFDNWNGYDYYDKKYIKDNFKFNPTNRLYPTIDHKISILYGFLNEISPEEIGSINNLCVTKKCINSIKKEKIESKFNIDDYKY